MRWGGNPPLQKTPNDWPTWMEVKAWSLDQAVAAEHEDEARDERASPWKAKFGGAKLGLGSKSGRTACVIADEVVRGADLDLRARPWTQFAVL